MKPKVFALKAIVKVTLEQGSEVYPKHVITGVKESLKQADEGKLTLYTGIKDMLKSTIQ
jgi:hypothetical protein